MEKRYEAAVRMVLQVVIPVQTENEGDIGLDRIRDYLLRDDVEIIIGESGPALKINEVDLKITSVYEIC